MTASRRLAFPALAAVLALAGALPAAADGFDEGSAKSKIEGAGYADVSEVHQGNLGDWMAQGTRDGHHVMLVLHPDGTVALRQQESVPPAKPIEDLAAPAKP